MCKKGSNALKKPSLVEIDQTQWAGANTRIQYALTEKNTLASTQDTIDYMSYTSYLLSLATKYEWIQILIFDDEYRTAQDTEGFRWGTDVPYLRALCLEGHLKRYSSNQVGDSTANAKQKKKRTGTPICHSFNYSTCKFTNCKYRHVCIQKGCYGPNPFSQHDKEGQGKD